jgi:ankyrin repeat protein
MVGHLLKPPHSADPTRSDKNGMDALRMAATFAKDPEIFDWLLAHGNIEIDRVDGVGHTALHAAALASNVVAVKRLINKGAHPNMFDKYGLSPLHLAAHYRDGNPIIDLLLEAQKVKGMGGGVDDPNDLGVTALHYAALYSNEITAEHLIQKGADPNRRANDGRTPLHMAVRYAKDMNIIDVLLKNVKNEAINTNDAATILASAKMNEHGLDDQIVARLKAKGIVGIDESQKPKINVEMIRLPIKTRRNIGTKRYGENGMNLLHVVSFSAKTTDVIDAVLETGEFDINGINNDGNTPLYYAMLGKNPTIIVAHLLQKGADPNVADKYGFMPLNMAVFSAKDVRLVELLLNHPDVDVNYLDNLGRNALDYAKDNKHGHGERIANLLKAKGAVERENKPDAMALDHAIKDSNVRMIRELINKGLKISTEKWGESKMNALHSASFHAKTTDVIDVILETGEFDINGGDNDGITPLHYALLGLYPKRNVPHLIQLGADPNVADKNGVTPLKMATRNAESMHLIELLLLNREPVGVGYCDKQEYYFYPTSNVCRVNS